MAIRFSCPACQQPIEVDDAWGGSSVACPYCRKVVAAPAISTWPPGDIPIASPVRPGFNPPPPPVGYTGPSFSSSAASVPSSGRANTNSAGWGLLLAIASAVLWGLGILIWWMAILNVAMHKVDTNATKEQLARAIREIAMSQSTPASPAATAVLFVGAFCGIAGLVLAIRSLVRGEQHTNKAIAACLLGGIAVFCQFALMMAMVSGRMAPH